MDMIKKFLLLLLTANFLSLNAAAFADEMPDYLSKIIPAGNINNTAGEHFTGKSFLYHQVRNMIGALIFLGTKRITIEKFIEIFNAKNRNLAPPTAPACGLYLVSVDYENF